MPQPEHPELDPIVRELIHAVPDKGLRRWRGWLRGENESGDDLRRRFDACGFTEQQVEFLWKLIYQVSDYQMHLLMDFIEYNATVGRLKIQVFRAPQSDEEAERGGTGELEVEISDGDMFPGHYIGWSEMFMEVSDDWQAEKTRDPAAPPRARPEPPPDARRCSFCGSDDYTKDQVWASPMEEGAIICTDCARLAMMFVGKGADGGADADPDQAET
jgi:hypothetical protein